MFKGKCKNKDHRSLEKNRKILPYGATKGKFWCWGCDAEKVPSWADKAIKKRERRKAKKEIQELESFNETLYKEERK